MRTSEYLSKPETLGNGVTTSKKPSPLLRPHALLVCLLSSQTRGGTRGSDPFRRLAAGRGRVGRGSRGGNRRSTHPFVIRRIY